MCGLGLDRRSRGTSCVLYGSTTCQFTADWPVSGSRIWEVELWQGERNSRIEMDVVTLRRETHETEKR